MTIIVGFGPETSSSVLGLADRLAEDDEQVVLCGVVLDTWEGPSLATGLDPQWRRGLVTQMQQTLDDAQEAFRDTVNVETTVEVASSVPAELLRVAQDRQGDVLVVGSSRRAALGRVSLGSISDQLVHSATVPVALTPNDYHFDGADRVQRIVLGVEPSDPSSVTDDAVAFARQMGVPVELVTFGVSPWPHGAPFDQVQWEGMFKDWQSQVQQYHEAVAKKLGDADVDVSGQQRIDAHRWASALGDFEWKRGDLLAVCSSRRGPVSRVFLGSTAARILRHTPVPTVVLPRTGR